MQGLAIGDALADSAKITGIAASQLSVYYRAARLAGLGASEFDHMIGRLNVNVAEAIQGDAKFAAVLEKAGVTLAKISSLSPDETFLALADAVSKTSSAFDRALIASSAFGRGGFRLLPLLSGGRAGISNLASSTRALGAAPGELSVARLEKANDAIQDLTTAWVGLKIVLADRLAPTITEVTTRFTNFLAATNFIPQLPAILANPYGVAAGFVADKLLGMPGGAGVAITPDEQAAIDLDLRKRDYRKRGFGPKKIAELEGWEMGPPSSLANPRIAPRFSSSRGEIMDKTSLDIEITLEKQTHIAEKQLGDKRRKRNRALRARLAEPSSLDAPGLIEAFGPRGDGQYRDRIGRTLHDVVLGDRSKLGRGQSFGWNYQFASETEKKGNILGELRSIVAEGISGWTPEEKRASDDMLTVLKQIRDKGGMQP
jgi:hypothetical protein